MAESVASKLLRWVEESFPAARASLRPPAASGSFERIRDQTGHEVPSTLKELWLRHDGQDDASASRLFEGFAWLSVGEALSSAASMKQVLDEVRRDQGPEERWLPEWLPFAQDIGGGLLVLDLANGEVFEYQSDGDGRERTWGRSFDGFIDEYLARLARGALRVDQQLGVINTAPVLASMPREPAVPARRKVLVLGLIALYVLAMAAFVSWLESRRTHSTSSTTANTHAP